MIYSLVTTIGLALDVIGVTLLFLYGMPPRIKIPHLEQPYTMFWYTEGSPDQGPPSKEDLERLETLKRRYSRLGSLGYVMVVSGFAMQAVASWMI